MSSTGYGTAPVAGRVTLVLCLAQVLGMVAFAAYSANLPGFIAEWGLTNTEAGWLAGVFSLGNILAIPVLVSLTDRMDARTVYLGSTAVMGLAHLGFGLAADGFWSAMLFRGLSGIGFGGTLIPGLRLLGDHVEGPGQARAITLYSSCTALGGATSFLVCGLTLPVAPWQLVFLFGAAGCLAAVLLVRLAVPATKRRREAARPALLDFRPVLRNRSAVAYIACNFGHTFENYGARGWTVAFLAFAAGLHGLGPLPWGLPTPILMSIIVVAGVFGNYAGGGLAARFGRRPAVLGIVVASLLAAVAAGASPLLPFVVVLALVMVHSVTMTMDNAVLNAGALAAAAPELRGGTMAVYGVIGFAGAMLGPTMFGLVLDLMGSGSILGWTMAFASLGLVGVLGSIGLMMQGDKGDRP